jgi:hypothetical protein
MKEFLLPPVTPSDEEPIAAGGQQVLPDAPYAMASRMTSILPPPVTLSDEEPIAAGGRYLISILNQL